MRAMDCKSRAPVSGQVNAELAQAMIIKAEVFSQNAGEGFSGECGGLGISLVVNGTNGDAQLIAEQLENVELEVLFHVLADVLRCDSRHTTLWNEIDQLARESSNTSPICTLSECTRARASMITSPLGGKAKS